MNRPEQPAMPHAHSRHAIGRGRAPARDPPRRHQGHALSVEVRRPRRRAAARRLRSCNVYVALPEDHKGTHMSRFVAARGARAAGARRVGRRLDALLDDLVARLDAPGGRIEIAFPFFVRKRAPVSGVASLLDYQVRLARRARRADATRRRSSVAVPVTSPLPVLEGDLRLRRAQPALARDDHRAARATPCLVARAAALRRGRGVVRAVRRSSAPTRSRSPSAPTTTRSSSRTWCATSRCG